METGGSVYIEENGARAGSLNSKLTVGSLGTLLSLGVLTDWARKFWMGSPKVDLKSGSVFASKTLVVESTANEVIVSTAKIRNVNTERWQGSLVFVFTEGLFFTWVINGF